MGFEEKQLLSLSEQISRYIKQAILNRDFQPGDKLPSEKELADEFLVSRATIREALKQLSASKLIFTKPGAKGGHYVTELAHESFIHSLVMIFPFPFV